MAHPPEPSTDAHVTVSNSDLLAADRFDWWCDVVDRNIAPFTLLSSHTRDFRALVRAVDLGAAQLARFSFAPLRGIRSPAHIRRWDPETYHLGTVHGSPLHASQRRNNATIDTGGLVLFDTSHPMEACYPDGYGTCEATILTLPRSLLPLPAGRADRLLSQPLVSSGVTGTLLCHYLTTVVGRAADLAPAESRRLGLIAVDLATALVADHLDAQPLLPAETRRHVLLARINAFIDQNLGDPDLKPAHIAAHHHVSVRSLHQLFRTEPETVAATIRRRRLERCRADLADPRLRSRPISALAARWGLLLPAEFSRAFRAAYGMTPREFRHTAAQRPPRSAPDHK
ncbi:helix-turn-helix domain-containing protein [Kitasatospora sp. NPDC047058]|uniref:AraC-like ligand-binding domain-containing protein n=1 Tax=Kitasatospora sp. NPDC047058 TaxID=3155620 RepID=UPI0033D0D9DD